VPPTSSKDKTGDFLPKLLEIGQKTSKEQAAVTWLG
jgi:hypothetical protein